MMPYIIFLKLISKFKKIEKNVFQVYSVSTHFLYKNSYKFYIRISVFKNKKIKKYIQTCTKLYNFPVAALEKSNRTHHSKSENLNI